MITYYLKKNSIKTNVATDEGNSQNEIGLNSGCELNPWPDSSVG